MSHSERSGFFILNEQPEVEKSCGDLLKKRKQI